MAEKKMNILSEEVNGENIQDVIANSSKVTDEIAEAAAKEIADKRKEKLTKDLIDIVQRSEFTVSSAVLQVRRSNRTNQRIKQYLKDLAALKEEIVSGKKAVSAWQDEALALKKQYDKDLIEIGNSIDKSLRELQELFPNSWSWRYSELIPGNRN